MKHSKTGSVLVYTLILVVLSLLMWVVVLNISSLLESNTQLQNIVRKISANILSKWNLSIKYAQILNANGTWFVDTIGCPTLVTLSGSVSNSTTASSLRFWSERAYCEGLHVGNPYQIYFSTGYTDFVQAEYQWDVVSLTGRIGDTTFLDGDNTLIDFSWSPTPIDSIDDNLNSDNYMITSTGSTLYPDGYQDDDADARKIIYGYVSPGIGFANIFWNNDQTTQKIEDNTNNNDGVNAKLGDVTTGRFYIDVNQDFSLKLYRFDKNLYNSSKELLVADVYESADIAGGIGYIQESWWVLSLSDSITGNEFDFDFQNQQ